MISLIFLSSSDVTKLSRGFDDVLFFRFADDLLVRRSLLLLLPSFFLRRRSACVLSDWSAGPD